MRYARLPVLALAIALSLLPVPAAAHPLLVGATPPSGTSAPVTPGRIVVSFTEVLDPARSSVVLVGPDGRATPWPSTVSGGTLAVEPPVLPDGTWRVRWAVTGSDGDRETGEYRFTVAAPAAAGAARPGPLERGGRLLLLVLGVLLCGLLLGGAVLPADPARRPVAGRRIATLRSVLWGLLFLGLLGDTAGLVAAGGGALLLVSAAGPPLLVAAGVTAALGVAVFDGGALAASRPHRPPGCSAGSSGSPCSPPSQPWSRLPAATPRLRSRRRSRSPPSPWLRPRRSPCSPPPPAPPAPPSAAPSSPVCSPGR